MSLSIIDGTIESMDLKRAAAKVRIYRTIVFRLPDGRSHTLAKPYVHETLARELAPGTKGRFYLFSSIDHRGLQAMRADDGRAIFAYPKNNEVVGLVLLVLSGIWVGATIVLAYGIPVLGTLVLALSIAIVLVNRKLRIDAERQFRSDNPGQADEPGTTHR
jgi:hypothetical protein